VTIIARAASRHGINEIVAATQEVVAAPAGPKMPRRKLTPDDELVITNRFHAGSPPAQIAADLGIARKVVEQFLDV